MIKYTIKRMLIILVLIGGFTGCGGDDIGLTHPPENNANGVCEINETGTDCNGMCESDSEAKSLDCALSNNNNNNICEIGEKGSDCDRLCLPVEADSIDCGQDGYALKDILVNSSVSNLPLNFNLELTAMGQFETERVLNISRYVEWSSDDTAITSIDVHEDPRFEIAVAAGNSLGSANITASLNDIKSKPYPIKVTAENVDLSTVKASASNTSIPLGFNSQVDMEVYFTEGTRYSTEDIEDDRSYIQWLISPEDTNATISDEGLLETKNMNKPVKLTIKGLVVYEEFKDLLVSDSIDIDVTDAESVSQTVTADKETVVAGLPVKFTMTTTFTDNTTLIAPENGTVVIWSIGSQEGEGATIDPHTGILSTTGDSVGSVTVTATAQLPTLNAITTKTITITDVKVKDLVITADRENVTAGLPIKFTMTTTFTDDTTHVASLDGKEFIWAIASQDGTGATIDANTGILMTTNDSVGNITITATGQLAQMDGIATKTITVTDAQVVSIAVTASNETAKAGVTVQFTATATMNTGTMVQINNGEVAWSITAQTGSGASINPNTGQLTTTVDSIGSLQVTATGLLSAMVQTATKTILIEPILQICGGAINDMSRTNASGECLKVTTDSNGLFFTSSPSLVTLMALNYDASIGNIDTNDGKTYSATYFESNIGADFGTFDQLVIGGDLDGSGNNGQYDRWCQNLNIIKFNGFSTWRRATFDELDQLRSDSSYPNPDLDLQGWPIEQFNWSTEIFSPGIFTAIYMIGGGETGSSPRVPGDSNYASCVSP